VFVLKWQQRFHFLPPFIAFNTWWFFLLQIVCGFQRFMFAPLHFERFSEMQSGMTVSFEHQSVS